MKGCLFIVNYNTHTYLFTYLTLEEKKIQREKLKKMIKKKKYIYDWINIVTYYIIKVMI